MCILRERFVREAEEYVQWFPFLRMFATREQHREEKERYQKKREREESSLGKRI